MIESDITIMVEAIVLVYYYTGICDVTVIKWNFKIGLVLPFKNAGQEKTECSVVRTMNEIIPK